MEGAVVEFRGQRSLETEVMQSVARTKSGGFTLIELLTVIGIISILAGLLFPVFASARGKSREITCASNLRQIGMAIRMYAQDYDELYPWAIDPTDRYTPIIWAAFPEFACQIPFMPLMQD